MCHVLCLHLAVMILRFEAFDYDKEAGLTWTGLAGNAQMSYGLVQVLEQNAAQSCR